MKLIITISIFLAHTQAYSQFQYKLIGDLTHLEDQIIYLEIHSQSSKYAKPRIDTSFIKNKKILFEGELEYPAVNAIIRGKKNGYLAFIMDSGKNEIIIKSSNSKLKNPFLYAEVKSKPGSNILKRIIDSLRMNQTANADHTKRREMRVKELQVINQNPDAYFSLMHLETLSYLKLSLSPKELLSSFNLLSRNVRETSLGMQLKKRLTAACSILSGNTIPQFSLADSSGRLTSNSLLNGKTYLLAFGATWCGPCNKNLPKLKELYSKFRQRDFEVFYVNLDTSLQKWKSTIRKNQLSWISVTETKPWDDSEIVELFDIRAIPFYLVINKAGKIIYNSIEEADYSFKHLERIIEKANE